jgi:hypothetical protein
VFFFFSHRVGCVGSVLISVAATLLLLYALQSCGAFGPVPVL